MISVSRFDVINYFLQKAGGASRLIEKTLSSSQESQLDFQAIRDRILTKLKLGRQSSAAKAIDAFIKDLCDK
ncbi:hypothetical protein [Nostoc sp. MG11]|uniref:hypothetical protein n=1 Tax=Nostoc sp. MG11 TaxID=2721166 RepID=UPI0018687A7D|nr:hypothetical protein [Nostoc sp. MG11]